MSFVGRLTILRCVQPFSETKSTENTTENETENTEKYQEEKEK
jgi:hypothetical protein